MSWKSLSRATKRTVKVPNKILLTLLFIVSGFVLFFGTPNHAYADPAQVYVRTNGSDANCDGSADVADLGGPGPGACAKQTIQAGVVAVAPGGTVNVAAGTYTEQININRPLTLIGAESSTIIQAPDPAPMTIYDNGTNYSPASRGKNKAIVRIGASNVNFQNFHVTPSNQILSGSSAYIGTGILVDHVGGATPIALTGITIQNNLVDGVNILDNFDAIRVLGQATVTISGNTLYAYASGHGIRLNGAEGIAPSGTYHPIATVTSNTIYAGSTTRPFAGTGLSGVLYGIYFISGAEGTASGNTIHGAYGWALNAWDAGDVSFTNNIIDTDGNPARTDKGHAAQLLGSSNRTSHIVFSNNTITNKLYTAIISQNLPEILTAQHNTITNTTDGFIFDHITSGTYTITNNSFNVTGTAIMGGTANTSSTAYGQWHGNSTVTIDGTNNWWGNASGPSGFGPGTGDAISDNITFNPWYTNAGMTTLSSAKAITTFSFPMGNGVIAGTNIGINVPFGTDVTSLIPTITFSAGASVSPNTGIANNFTAAQTYTVTAADSSTQTYTVTVTVLANTQTAPDAGGAATIDNSTPQVVITNPTQAVDLTISSGTTNPTIDVSAFITDGTGVLPQITIESDNADIAIPGNTTVTSEDASWDGVIAAPTVTTITLPETAGETRTLSTAIEIGFSGAKLSFDKAVRILLPGQAGKKAGYVRTGIAFTEITNICAADNQATGDALVVDGDCKIDVGADMVIWTKHFTKFATYTQATTPIPAPSTTTTTSTSSKPVKSAARGTGAGVLGESSNAQIATPLSTTVKELPAAGVAAPAVEKATHLKWYWYVAIVALAMVTAGVYYVYQSANKNKTDKES